MPAAIIQWLNSDRDYEAGRILYEKYGTSQAFKDLFKRYNNSYTQEKLADELQAIQNQETPPKPKKWGQKDTSELPDIIRFKEKHKNDLYAQFCDHHAKLRTVTTDHLRYKHAKAIMDIRPQIRMLWKELDHYAATGEISLPTGNFLSGTVMELRQRYDNYASYVRRYKKKDLEKAAKYAAMRDQVAMILEGKN